MSECPTCKRPPSERVACHTIGERPTVVLHCSDPIHDLADRAPELQAWIDDAHSFAEGSVAQLRVEIDRLRAVIRETHTTYCAPLVNTSIPPPAWANGQRHAPECLLFEIEE